MHRHTRPEKLNEIRMIGHDPEIIMLTKSGILRPDQQFFKYPLLFPYGIKGLDINRELAQFIGFPDNRSKEGHLVGLITKIEKVKLLKIMYFRRSS